MAARVQKSKTKPPVITRSILINYFKRKHSKKEAFCFAKRSKHTRMLGAGAQGVCIPKALFLRAHNILTLCVYLLLHWKNWAESEALPREEQGGKGPGRLEKKTRDRDVGGVRGGGGGGVVTYNVSYAETPI